MANPFTGTQVVTSLKDYDALAYVRNLYQDFRPDFHNLSFDDLMKMAKRVQSAANRRYDVLYQHKEMKGTAAYQAFNKQGKISLSKGFFYNRNGRRTFDAKLAADLLSGNPSKSAQSRYTTYILHEIERGIKFLMAETSTVAGYKNWQHNSIAGMGKVMKDQVARYYAGDPQGLAAAEAKIAEWQKTMSTNRDYREYFWEVYHGVADMNGGQRYMARTIGSDVVVDAVYKAVEAKPNAPITEVIEIVNQAVRSGTSIDDAISLIERLRRGEDITSEWSSSTRNSD